MALEKVSTILKMADEANTAAIAFICIDYNMVYSVIKTAEQMNTPVIVMLLPEHASLCGACGVKGFAEMVKELAADVKVPVGLHLDHSYSYESVAGAIKKGFPSVMIDGSAKPLEENIALTAKVTEMAHLFGVDVEAELGHVGLASSMDGSREDLYTSPETAELFCSKTQIDSLTVAIGSAHGVYVETPQLDVKRLTEINAATDVPLVLHGGSGIPEEQLRVVFQKGINKFNVGTEFLEVYYDTIRSYVKKMEGNDAPLKMLEIPLIVQERLQEYLRHKLQLSQF